MPGGAHRAHGVGRRGLPDFTALSGGVLHSQRAIDALHILGAQCPTPSSTVPVKGGSLSNPRVSSREAAWLGRPRALEFYPPGEVRSLTLGRDLWICSMITEQNEPKSMGRGRRTVGAGM